ncbi:MAG: hypothetical protein ACFB2Y_16850 [Fulvivirga sp.]
MKKEQLALLSDDEIKELISQKQYLIGCGTLQTWETPALKKDIEALKQEQQDRVNLLNVPTLYRTVYQLRQSGLTYREIAMELQCINADTAKAYCYRAMLALKNNAHQAQPVGATS